MSDAALVLCFEVADLNKLRSYDSPEAIKVLSQEASFFQLLSPR
eukprot:CAMPEP_0170502070 /NCGR_PEP_ID=MMETSP0208-20121228/40339_1 /TAXON_ID=197538 /ORGANISM="Strombidium inclinatum, Strain S3" /LENGTH=43 /DNA_ID= /DNA_START= /DNA_END= /DNA_ORIENTATION=